VHNLRNNISTESKLKRSDSIVQTVYNETPRFWRYFQNVMMFLSGVKRLSLVLLTKKKTKLRDLSPRAKYTDRAIAACRRTFADRGCHVISLTDPCGRIHGFLDRTRVLQEFEFPPRCLDYRTSHEHQRCSRRSVLTVGQLQDGSFLKHSLKWNCVIEEHGFCNLCCEC
jgi:hypothetical protein